MVAVGVSDWPALAFAALVVGAGWALTVEWRWRRGQRHAVYYIPDAAGELLYVGFGRDPVARLKRHRTYQATLPDGHPRKWWHLVHPDVQRTYQVPHRWRPNEASARAFEAAEVRRLNPPANRIKYRGVRR